MHLPKKIGRNEGTQDNPDGGESVVLDDLGEFFGCGKVVGDQGKEVVEAVCQDGSPERLGPIDQIDKQGAEEPTGDETEELKVDEGKEQADQTGGKVDGHASLATETVKQGTTEEQFFANGGGDAHQEDVLDPPEQT